MATRFSSSTLIKTLLELNANILAKNSLEDDSLTVIIKRLADLGNMDSRLPYGRHFRYMFNKSIKVLKKLLNSFPSNSIDVDLLIKESTKINEPEILKKVLNIIFTNKKFIKNFLYKDLNMERLLFIKNINVSKDFKNEIMGYIDTFLVENRAFLIKVLFSYDTFIFRNKSLLISAFFNLIKLNKFEDNNDVKEINKLLTSSLIDYYNDKLNNKIGYEDRFLKEIEIIKAKINIFVFNLYNKKEDIVSNIK